MCLRFRERIPQFSRSIVWIKSVENINYSVKLHKHNCFMSSNRTIQYYCQIGSHVKIELNSQHDDNPLLRNDWCFMRYKFTKLFEYNSLKSSPSMCNVHNNGTYFMHLLAWCHIYSICCANKLHEMVHQNPNTCMFIEAPYREKS